MSAFPTPGPLAAGALLLSSLPAAGAEPDEPDVELLEYLGEFADQDDWSWFDASSEQKASAARTQATSSATSQEDKVTP